MNLPRGWARRLLPSLAVVTFVAAVPWVAVFIGASS